MRIIKFFTIFISLLLIGEISSGFIGSDPYFRGTYFSGEMPVYLPDPDTRGNRLNLTALTLDGGDEIPRETFAGIADLVWFLTRQNRQGLPGATLLDTYDYHWKYWAAYRSGNKDSSITRAEILNGRGSIEGLEVRIRRLKEAGTIVDSRAEGEWREALTEMIRYDLAVDNMDKRLGPERARTVVDIINYLNGYILEEGVKKKVEQFTPYTYEDIKLIEMDLRLQIFLLPKFEKLLGEPVYAPYPDEAGVFMGLIKGFRPIRDRFGWNVTTEKMIDTIFNIWGETKGLIEEVLIRRKLILQEPTGAEFGFLRGNELDVWNKLRDTRSYTSCRMPWDGLSCYMGILRQALLDGDRGLSQIKEATEWVKSKLKIEGRLLPLMERKAGHAYFDIFNKDSDNMQALRFFEAGILRYFGLTSEGRAVSPLELMDKFQWGSFPTPGNMYSPLTARPLESLVVKDTPINSRREIKERTIFKVAFGDWSFINQLVFNSSFSGANSGTFEIKIRNAKGEEAVYKIEDLQKDGDGSRVIIPLWGPSDVPWADEGLHPQREYLSNPIWRQWLDAALWEQKGNDLILKPNRGEVTVKKIKDKITDWKNIEEIEITPLAGTVLNLGGVSRLSSQTVDFGKRADVFGKLDAGNKILVKARDRARVNRSGSPRPLDWTPGFRGLNISGADVVILGRNAENIKFVVPRFCQNILVMDYRKFIQEIWDNERPSYLIYK